MIRRSFLKGTVAVPFGNSRGQGFNNPVAENFSAGNTRINKSGMFIYSGPPAANNLIESHSNKTGVDQYGNQWIQGDVIYTPGASTVQAVQIYNSQVVFWAATVNMVSTSPVWWQQAGNIQGIISLEETGVNGTQPGLHFGVTSSSNLWLDNGAIIQGGVLRAAQPGSSPVVPETWHNVSLSVTGITVNVLRYMLAPDNKVHIQFHLTVASTAASGALQLITLSAAYTPSVDFRGCAPGLFSNAGTYLNATYNSRFNVTTGGVAQILGFPGGSIGGSAITEIDGYYIVPLD